MIIMNVILSWLPCGGMAALYLEVIINGGAFRHSLALGSFQKKSSGGN